MAAKALPPQDVLRQLLDYDPETGGLTWKPRGPEWFNATPARSAEHTAKVWNQRYAGKPALNHVDANGYRTGNLLGIATKAHRAIWKMETGQDPDQIDHLSGNRQDNRWINLRDVTAAENTRNHKRRSDNRTGITGIYWYYHNRRQGKWLVKVGNRHVGLFDCIGQAIRARREAERRHGFAVNHGRAA